MPQIILKQSGQNSADFSTNGAVITVAGVVVNCEAREEDVTQTIEIRQHEGVAQEGGEGALLAQIEIPARRYVDEEGPLGEDEQPREIGSNTRRARRGDDQFCTNCDVSLDLHYDGESCEIAIKRAELIGSFYSRVMHP